jgi:hypothetical protein
MFLKSGIPIAVIAIAIIDISVVTLAQDKPDAKGDTLSQERTRYQCLHARR